MDPQPGNDDFEIEQKLSGESAEQPSASAEPARSDVETGAEEFEKLAESGPREPKFLAARSRSPEPKDADHSESGDPVTGASAADSADGGQRRSRRRRSSASQRPARRSKPRFRIDAASSDGLASAEADAGRMRTRRPARQLSFDESHGRSVPAPHFEYTLREPEPRDNFGIVAGQWLAYLGVLGLTVGTAIVVYGHFGGYSNYTPTGWLVTTVGQMLLFLGVINLVSGGMEQSNDEVSQRIEMLGEHILRIEQASDRGLRGPKIPAAVYDGEEHVSDRVDAADDSYLEQ